MTATGVPQNDSFDKLLTDVFGVTAFPADAPPLVERARHFELATRLKTDGYSIYVTVVATHFLAQAAAKTDPELPERYEVATVLHGDRASESVRTNNYQTPKHCHARSRNIEISDRATNPHGWRSPRFPR